MKYEIGDYKTQHGKPAKVLFIDEDGELFGIASPRGTWHSRKWTPDGKCYDNERDALEPLRREWWIVETGDIGNHVFAEHSNARLFAAEQDFNREIIHVREVLEDD